MLKKIRAFMGRHALALTTGAAATAGGVFAMSGVSGADVIDSSFTSVSASLVTDLGYAAAAVVTVVGLSVGIKFLVSWLRHLGKAAA
jgi:hypothetical protein